MADFDNLLSGLVEQERQDEGNDIIGDDDEQNSTIMADDEDGNGENNGNLDAGVDGNEEDYPNENVEIPAALQTEQQQQQHEQYRPYEEDNEENIDTNMNLGDRREDQLEVSGYNPSQQVTDEDYETIKHLWVQELNCAELLPYQHVQMEMLMELTEGQEHTLLDLQSGNDNSGTDINVDPTLASIAAGICKMDMDRMKFLLSDLLRVRIEKIERYWMHLTTTMNEDEMVQRMSIGEIEYLQSYAELFRTHLERSVTDGFPKEAWKKIDEDEMIPRPNMDTFCFCRVLDEDGVTIDNHAGIDVPKEIDDDDDDEEEDESEWKRFYDHDSLLFVRFGAIRDLVFEGRIELVM